MIPAIVYTAPRRIRRNRLKLAQLDASKTAPIPFGSPSASLANSPTSIDTKSLGIPNAPALGQNTKRAIPLTPGRPPVPPRPINKSAVVPTNSPNSTSTTSSTVKGSGNAETSTSSTASAKSAENLGTKTSNARTLLTPPAPATATKQVRRKNTNEQLTTDLFSESGQPLVYFNYTNEDLVSIINWYTARKNMNIILPQFANAIKDKITIDIPKKMTFEEGWELLQKIMTIAGYSFTLNGDFYRVTRDPKDTYTREPLHTFIGTNPQDLPNVGKVRYVYYLAHIKATDDDESELQKILKELLPQTEGNKDSRSFKLDPATNAIVFIANAADIKGVMEIIKELDKPGFAETLEIIKLNHTEALMVEKIFNEKILKAAGSTPPYNPYHLDAKKPGDENFFIKSTRIKADPRINSLIVIGRAQAAQRIREFITNYIDVELDSGRSILHVYQLQYLDANEELITTLNNLIKSTKPGGTQQSTLDKVTANGPERFFDEVIISSDRPKGLKPPESLKAEQIFRPDSTAEIQSTNYYGGNKLIIAARNEDWKRIKKLLEELDMPQPSVVLEIMIADLTIEDQRMLGSIFRNPAKIPFVNQANIQSAQLPPGIQPDNYANPTTIGVNFDSAGNETAAADVLGEYSVVNGLRVDPIAGQLLSAASSVPPGGSLISFSDNDGKTWGLLEVVKIFGWQKIISNPHVIAVHNKEAEVYSGLTELVPDAASGGVGATILKNASYSAMLKVRIRPQISAGNTVNLQIVINIEDFIPGTTPNAPAKTIRDISTNANVKTGGILALGGLLRDNDNETLSKTPILGDVPIFGWFFKNRAAAVTKSNLTVFICPTIIKPRLRQGIGEYTKDYVKVAEDYAHRGSLLFDSLRDPITRWYFKPDANAPRTLHEFLDKDELQGQDLDEVIKARRERRKKLRKSLPEDTDIVVFNKEKATEELKKVLNSETEKNPLVATTDHHLEASHPQS